LKAVIITGGALQSRVAQTALNHPSPEPIIIV
jgi:hypothetical protein